MSDARDGGSLGRLLDVAWAITGTCAAVIGLRLMLTQQVPPPPSDGGVDAGDSGQHDAGDEPRPLCPEGMALIPGGRFVMGTSEGESIGLANERPAHSEDVGSFCLGETEVTVSAYEACVRAGTPHPCLE